MDFNTVMQTVLTLMVGALCWFIQRSVKKLDEGIAKLDEKITDVDKTKSQEIKQLRQDFNDFLKDAPLIFSLREDTIRFMNSVEDKLNWLIHERNGGDKN